jgi:hypothetical protein
MTKRIPRSLAASLLVAFVGLGAAPAAAEETAPTSRSSWYGWQTLLVDGGVLGATLATKNHYVFLGGYTLGAPIVHWAHGNVWRGFASLGLRVAAPLAASLLAAELDRPDVPSGHEAENAIAWGVLGGSVVATILDAALLARTVEDAPARAPRATAWRVEPRVSASPRGAFAGLGGRF